MDAPNPAAAAKAAPGKIGKAIKGHKPVVYIGVIGLALILAYYIRKREQNAAVTPGGDLPPNAVATDLSATTPDYGSPYAGGTFGPTQGAADQGAYYGFPTPDQAAPSGFSTQDLVDLIYALNPGGYYSGQPAASPDPQPSGTPASQGSPTGGGVSARNVQTHAAPAKATIVATIPKGGTSAPIHDHPNPPDPKYPFLSTRGWYQVVTNYKTKGDRWHFYANGVKEKVG